jgi:hypothetical protein
VSRTRPCPCEIKAIIADVWSNCASQLFDEEVRTELEDAHTRDWPPPRIDVCLLISSPEGLLSSPRKPHLDLPS